MVNKTYDFFAKVFKTRDKEEIVINMMLWAVYLFGGVCLISVLFLYAKPFVLWTIITAGMAFTVIYLTVFKRKYM